MAKSTIVAFFHDTHDFFPDSSIHLIGLLANIIDCGQIMFDVKRSLSQLVWSAM